MEAPVARLFLLLLLGSWTPASGSASSEAPPLINEDVKRTVDLSSHLAKVTAEVVLAHLGGSSTSRATSFLLALEPELEARLAHLGVQVSVGHPSPPLPGPFLPVPRLRPRLSRPQEMRRPGRRAGRRGRWDCLGAPAPPRPMHAHPHAWATSALAFPRAGRCSRGQLLGFVADPPRSLPLLGPFSAPLGRPLANRTHLPSVRPARQPLGPVPAGAGLHFSRPDVVAQVEDK